MKATRKLIPAIVMLLVSAIVLSTASYAWFSMNTTVTASGMTVTAKADNTFLIIAAGTSIGDANAISATATLSQNVFPTHPLNSINSTNVATITSWGTASSSDLNDANTGAEVTALASTKTFGDYVAKQSFMVGRAADTTQPENGLRMSSITLPANTGISAVVVCGTNIHIFTESSDELTNALAANTAVTEDGVQVDVYIYIDGANANVYTNNIAALTGEVSMTFTVDAAE